MNPDVPKTPREELEAKVTALLLGGLPDEQAKLLQEVISRDAELKLFHDRMQRTIELVRNVSLEPAHEAGTPSAPLKLADEKRQQLLQQFKTLKPKEFAQPKKRGPSWYVPLAAAAAILIILALALPAFAPATSRSKMRFQSARLMEMTPEASVRLEPDQTVLSYDYTPAAPANQPDRGRIALGQAVEKEVLRGALSIADREASIINSAGAKPNADNASRGQRQPAIVLPQSGDEVGRGDQSKKATDNFALYVQDGEKAAKSESLAKAPAEQEMFRRWYGLQQSEGRPGLNQEHSIALGDTPSLGRRFAEGEAEVSPDGRKSDNSLPMLLGDHVWSDSTRRSSGAAARPSIDPATGLPNIEPTTGLPLSGLAGPTEAQAETPPASVPQAPAATPIPPPPAGPPAVSAGAAVIRGGQDSILSKGTVVLPDTTAGESTGKAELAGRDLRRNDLWGLMSTESETAAANRKGQAGNFGGFGAGGGGGVGGGGFGPVSRTERFAAGGYITTNSVRGFYDDNAAAADSLSLQKDLGVLNGQVSEKLRANVIAEESLQARGEGVKITEALAGGRSGIELGFESKLGGLERKLKEPARPAAGKPVTEESKRLADSKLSLAPKGEAAPADGLKQQEQLAREQVEIRAKAAVPADEDALAKVRPATPPPVPQPEVQTVVNPFSTFSLNVADVSFKLAAASLEQGAMPDPGSIRSEEFINALDYRDPEAAPGTPFAFAWERARYPFAHNRDLLRFSLKTAALGRQPGRALNLVLLLDNSGSMERADRVRILQQALRVLALQLQPQDKFSIVNFSRTARLIVDGVAGNQAAQAAEEAGRLTPQGGTNIEEAMRLGYETALRHYLAGGVNRVILLTDGAANLGNVDPDALKASVENHRRQGIAFDCFGIGWEGYNDDLLEVLARNGDGRYGFINSVDEASTEFAGQLAGALQVAASDVKVQVEFNPARVSAYRQIGYAKHQLTKEQFRDNTVDAAEIASAESGNALYIIETLPAGQGPVATVRVRYKVPGTTEYHEHEWAVPYSGTAMSLDQASPAMRLAATASAFSEWLASSPYAGEVNPDRLLATIAGVPDVYGADPRPRKLEWMIRQAKSISGR